MIRSHLRLALSLTLLALSCSSGGAGAGRVTVLLKDAPGPDVRSAVVTIAEVDLVGDAGAVVLRDTPVTTDLLTLATDVATLVDGAAVPAGTYSQLRFVITGAYLDVGGTLYASSPTYEGLPQGAVVGGQLQTPSYGQSGLKVILPDGGLVVGDAGETLVVDFDVAQSFGHGTGQADKWVMHPVVKATRLQQTASVEVTLGLAPGVVLPATVTLADFTALLSPAGGGDITPIALADRGDGTFAASFPLLAAGDYTVTFGGPSDLADFATDPATPLTVTVPPGQVIHEDFLITSVVLPPPL